MPSPAAIRPLGLGRSVRARMLQLGLACGVAAGMAPALAPPAARAIPEAEAYKKLQVVPVFVITDPKGVIMPIPRENDQLLPLYLESSQADKELSTFQKTNPTVKAVVTAVPLNVMNEKILQLNKQRKEKTKPIAATVIVGNADLKSAISLLRADGLSDAEIKKGLSVPVFFLKPFLPLTTAQGPKAVFYLNYSELQAALAQVPADQRSRFKPQVADLWVVMQVIVNSPKDEFVIFPTPEYFRLVKESQAKAQPAALAKP